MRCVAAEGSQAAGRLLVLLMLLRKQQLPLHVNRTSSGSRGLRDSKQQCARSRLGGRCPGCWLAAPTFPILLPQ